MSLAGQILGLLESGPEVGVWFYVNGKVYKVSETVRNLGPDAYTWAPLHKQAWEKELQPQYPELKGINYFAVPRGRVIYEPDERKFYISLGSKFFNDKKMQSEIASEFSLPPNNSVVIMDSSYNV